MSWPLPKELDEESLAKLFYPNSDSSLSSRLHTPDWGKVSLAGFTPQQVFSGEYREVDQVRQAALDNMYELYPQRFRKGRPVVQMPPAKVCINLVPEDADRDTIGKGVNFPTLQRVIKKAI